jgi:hypothetical protein
LHLFWIFEGARDSNISLDSLKYLHKLYPLVPSNSCLIQMHYYCPIKAKTICRIFCQHVYAPLLHFK